MSGRDHAGGNEKIEKLVPGIKFCGGSIDNVKGCTNKLENGDKLELGADVNILSLHTPWLAGLVLLGSVLVSSGCCSSSLGMFIRWPVIWEYTEKNLRFALVVEPENIKTKEKLSWAQHQRQANLPTIPSTIAEELETNPLMRVDLPELQVECTLWN
ncbi:hypothetical protein ACLOJK_031529 [Asimina triloba]